MSIDCPSIFTTVLTFKVQSADEVINQVNTTKLAYVKTGNKVVDEISKNGILSISEYITSKTSVILGFPDEINLDDVENKPWDHVHLTMLENNIVRTLNSICI